MKFPCDFPVASGKICIELVIIQKFREVHATGIELHIRFLRAKEEACRIQRVRIKIRKDGVHQLLHIAVKGRVRHAVNGKENMELRPCRLSVFLPVIEAAVVDGKAYAGKRFQHIGGLDPIRRIF